MDVRVRYMHCLWNAALGGGMRVCVQRHGCLAARGGQDAVLRMCQDGWSGPGHEHGSNSRVNQRTLMKYSSVQLKRVEIKEPYLKRTPSVIKGRPRYLETTPGVIKES